MRCLALALLLATASCNSLYMNRNPTNLVVEDLQVGALGSVAGQTVIPIQATVANNILQGRLVDGTAKLRVFASVRLEDPLSFDPANPPTPQFDANGNPIDPALQPTVRFAPAGISQPSGSGPGDPVEVGPGTDRLIVDVVAIKGNALLPGKQVTFDAVGYVTLPWPNAAPGSLFLDLRVARNSKGGDHDPTDNRKIVPIASAP